MADVELVFPELDVQSIHCASCGATILPAAEDWDPDYRNIEALVRCCARHLMLNCPARYGGHEAFGFEPRWSRVRLAVSSMIEVAWSTSAFGNPFLLYKVPGFKNGISGRSDWRLDEPKGDLNG